MQKKFRVLYSIEWIKEDIEKLKPFKGSRITGEIDPSRRTSLTQNHTATHLIVAAARRVLGGSCMAGRSPKRC